jgi:hypothetical protein
MANFNPAVLVAPVIYPRPVTGFRRLVQVAHPMCGAMTLLSTDVSFTDSGSPNFTKYVYTPGINPDAQIGIPYQKVIHTVGTREISWTIGGEVTEASLGLLALLTGSARGVNFDRMLISQGNVNFFFDNPTGVALPWNQVSVNGNSNASLTFSLEGKSTVDPFPDTGPPGSVFISTQVPSWATGNDLVLSWSLSHSVNLQPFWFNTLSTLPAYYRVLDSEFTLQLTTAVALSPYTLIKIGYGYINLVSMVVTSENITFGDRNSPVTYQVSSTNAGMQEQDAYYTDFVDISLQGVPDASYS